MTISSRLRRWKPVGIGLLLGLLALLPFWDLAWLPPDQIVGGNDLLFLFRHWWTFAREALQQGEFPLWNPYLFAGQPFIANPQPALFYPPTWLALLLPASRAAGLLFIAHLWLAAVGMVAWLRSEGAGTAGALFGAAIFAFGGHFFVRIYGGHLGVVMTQAWLPIILWATRRAVKRGGWPSAIVAGIPVAMSLLAGHTASFFYVALIQFAYVLHLAWAKGREDGRWQAGLGVLVRAGAIVGVGVGLAAIQLLPTMEFLAHSTRQEASYAFASNYAWSPGYLLTLLVPNFFGEPVRTGYWGIGIYTELILYVGVLPLLLSLTLGLRLRHRRAGFLLALAGAGLLLALGPFTILHRLAYNLIPLFRAARAPARAGFLFVFAIAALGGLLVTWLRSTDEGQEALRRWGRGPLLWALAGLALLVILAGYLIFALQRESNPEIGRLWHVADHTALFLLFLLLSIGLMRAWQSRRVTGEVAALLAAGLVMLDLWSFGRPLVQAVPVEESAYWRGVAGLAGEGRILPTGLSIFDLNHGMAWDLESVFGYDPLELEWTAALIATAPDHRARAYDLLHTRYLVTTAALEAEDPTLELVGEEGGAWVYERATAQPRAWLVHQVEIYEDAGAALGRLNDPAFDPSAAAVMAEGPPCAMAEAPEGVETVDFERLGNSRVTVSVDAGAPGILVLSEVYYPGWRATVDGAPAPVLRVDHALRGVCVPAGVHQVELSFVPLTFWIGAGISALASILVIVAIGIRARRALLFSRHGVIIGGEHTLERGGRREQRES